MVHLHTQARPLWLAALVVAFILPARAQQLLSPGAVPKYVNALPIPAVIDARAGGEHTIEMTQFEQDLGLGLKDALGNPVKTKVWGYNGSYPGPTFLTRKDVPVRVYWYNHLTSDGTATGTPLPHLLPIDESIHWAFEHLNENWRQYGIPLVTHLHGGHTESASDGLPEAWYTPNFTLKGMDFKKGESEPYYYQNDQEAATLWYHDHALGITRLNVYAGLAGFYILTDENEQHLKQTHKLPADQYDIGLAIQDRMFTTNGQLYFPLMPEEPGAPEISVLPEFFGNIILVNGKAWPVLDVEPRQYRFRMLNGSDSRFYNLFMSEPLRFWQIGSDNGLLPTPVAHNQLLIAPGERKDVIIDFSDPALWGKTIVLRNNAKEPYPKGSAPDPNAAVQIMAFRVSVPLSAQPLTPVPGANELRAALPAPPNPTKVRKLILFEGEDEYGRLKPMLGTFEDGALDWEDEITENPGLNDTEVWEVYNTTPDTHPIHLHLVSFRALSSQKFKADFADDEKGTIANVRLLGQPTPPPPGQDGRKDTYPVAPGEVTRLIATFDKLGLYVWHCHILSHEDHEMMRPYYVGEMPEKQMIANSNRQALRGATPANDAFSIYPNPFASSATIQFSLKQASAVAVRVFDMSGRMVRNVPVKELAAGNHQLELNGTGMPEGLYICEVKINNKLQRSKLIVAR